jgi:hypothetical protein
VVVREVTREQSAMHNKQPHALRRHGVTDLDNALGGSYNHPQHSSRLRVSDQQLLTYMVIVLTALLLLLHRSDLALTRPAGPTGSEATTSLLLSP